MADTITITLEVSQAAIDAVCAADGYEAQILKTDQETGERRLVPNPVTPAEFAREQMRAYFRNRILTHRSRMEVDAAKERARQSMNNLVI